MSERSSSELNQQHGLSLMAEYLCAPLGVTVHGEVLHSAPR